jgi:DNA-binding IclR family transcriptional regulator
MKDGHYQIGVTLLRLVHSYDNANDLFKAVRKAHPTRRKRKSSSRPSAS